MHSPNKWEKYIKYFYIFFKYLFFFGIIAFSFFLIYWFRIVTVPLIVAFFLSYILAPIVSLFERWKINRTLIISLLIVFTFLIFALFIIFISPNLFAQLSSLMEKFPELLKSLELKTKPFIEKYFGITIALDEKFLRETANEFAKSFVPPTKWIVENIFTSLVNIGVFFLNLIIMTVFTFYILKHYHKITNYIYEMIPQRYHKKSREILTKINESLSGFIRGEITICIILAALYSIGLTIVGIQFAPAIGVISGLVNIIPYMSTIFGLSSSLLMAVLDFPGWLNVIGIFIVFTVVPLIDALFLTPNIIGQKAGLNPMVVIIAILLGGKLFGILGMLLAVPLASIVKVILIEAVVIYKKSSFYQS